MKQEFNKKSRECFDHKNGDERQMDYLKANSTTDLFTEYFKHTIQTVDNSFVHTY